MGRKRGDTSASAGGASSSKKDKKEASSKRPRRRRLLMGKKQNKPSSDDSGQGPFADGTLYGAINWFWRTTGDALSSSAPGIGGGGPGSVSGVLSSGAAGGVVLVLGLAAGAAVYVSRRNKRAIAAQSQQAQQVEEVNGREKKEDEKQEGKQQSQRLGSGKRNRPLRNGACPLNAESGSRPRPVRSDQRPKNSTSVGRSGARRVSLYDVLTGDSPLPPRAETATTATSGVTAAGARGGGDGTIPAGCARRASIFDRIADVVFNEEQKDENPVDAVAVRNGLDDEFRVSFREGAMGMTLSMDPDTRNAHVGKIVPHGQAYRAGVHVNDLVVGVGEHNVSSYGTVLAFMNILGRPIELRFRKEDTHEEGSNGVTGSGGGPVSISGAGAAADGGRGNTPAPEGCATPSRGSRDRLRLEGSPRKLKAASHGGPKAPLSPISPRSSSKVSGLGGLAREVASSDSTFSDKMERGVVVTKYGKKGAAAQRVLFLDAESKSVAWRELDARSPGHRRAPSLTNLMKGRREALPLAHLVEVVAGDESDPARPSAKGSSMLREHCDETLLERSFALQFRERSLEMTCDSQAEMRQLVAGFRDLQEKYGA